MLILNRRQGQRLHIGDGIVVEVLAVQGKQVRLGITAPTDVVVRRGELSAQDPTEATGDGDTAPGAPPPGKQD